MDLQKMAEGKQRAAEQRRAAEAERLAEDERRRAEAESRRAEEEQEREQRREAWEKKQLDPHVIRDFSQLETQLTTFYDELGILSKKAPNGPLNKFKLKFVNDTLKKVNVILGDGHRPFPDFDLFPESDMPSNSDAVLMLSHYLKSMDRIRDEHTHQKSSRAYTGTRYWCIKGEPFPEDTEDEDDEE